MDIDSEDAKLAFIIIGTFVGFILFLVGVMFLFMPTRLDPTLTTTLGSIFSPGGFALMVLCIWYFKSDRQGVENDILRLVKIIFGCFHFGIGRFKGVGKLLIREFIEFDATHHLYALDEPTIRKAFAFERRKIKYVKMIDSETALSENQKLRILHSILSPGTDFDPEKDSDKYQTIWLKEIQLPSWARHFTQINLRNEFYVPGGISVWQLFVVTGEPFLTEFQDCPYTISGLRPFQFIDCKAAPVWLFQIGEFLSEVQVTGQEAIRKSFPIMAPFIDLAISENLMRGLEVDDTNTMKERLGTEMKEYKDGIIQDARTVVIEFLKSTIGFMAEELDSFKHGDSETLRKMQKMDADVFDYKENEKDYIALIRHLRRQIVTPPPPDPNKYSKGLMRAVAMAMLMGGFAIGIVASPFLPFFK